MRQVLAISSLVCILALACEETQEGCLDILASNYGFEAVNACDSCCTYPTFSIRMNLINDTLAYNLNDSILLISGDTLLLTRFQLVYSDFSFSNADTTYRIRDSLDGFNAGLLDDFIYIQSETSITGGRTRLSDTITGVRFRNGFDRERINALKPFDNIDQDSRLDTALDCMYVAETEVYRSAIFSLRFVPDTTVVELPVIYDEAYLDYELDRFVPAGTGWTLDFELDVSRAFEGLNAGMPSEVMSETIAQNIPAALTVR